MSALLQIAPQLLAVVVIGSIGFEVCLYVSAAIEMRANRSRNQHQLWRRVLASPLVPRISVLVPAYNEEIWIAESVRRTLALRYPDIEVIVVNDGSTDLTMRKLYDGFGLSPVMPAYRRQLETAHVRSIYRSKIEPSLVVVDKDNGGKADALNVALNIASGDLVCAIDADTVVTSDALLQLVAPFLSHPDTEAVGGTIRLIDGRVPEDARDLNEAPRSLLLGTQTVEYLRSFLIGRLGWNALGGSLVISGAFGLCDRQRMIDVGGYDANSIGEDMELVVRLRRKAYDENRRARVVFAPNPIAWTEAPASWRTLGRQRNRWFRGLLDVLVRHRDMVLRPKYGTAGMIALPYFIIVEALSPILEALGLFLVAVGLITGSYSSEQWGLLALAYGFGIARTVGVLTLSDLVYRSHAGFRSRLRMAAFIVMEVLVMRPATIVWRLWGLWSYLRGDRSWGEQERRGLALSEGN
jgi:cellulose synthase/poly-beta-1,6-N-acetylglucosamine synthase-like glycosyltransferase